MYIIYLDNGNVITPNVEYLQTPSPPHSTILRCQYPCFPCSLQDIPPGCSRYSISIKKPLGLVLEQNKSSGIITVVSSSRLQHTTSGTGLELPIEHLWFMVALVQCLAHSTNFHEIRPCFLRTTALLWCPVVMALQQSEL